MSTEDQDNAMLAQQAKDWLARVHAPDATDADIEGLTDWLNLSDVHLTAFDAAELAWAAKPEPESEPVAVPFRVRPSPRLVKPAWIWGVAAGAVAATVIGAVLMQSPRPVIYETKKGEMREVVLDDGTFIQLNTDTRVSVRMGKTARTLNLEHGELAAKVAHNAARPFAVEIGDDSVRDIGTEFNVSRLDGMIRVNVREGSVAFTPKTQPSTVRAKLGAGDEGVQHEGKADVVVTRSDPAAAFAWQQRRVIYRDQTLAFVIKDLNRYMKTPLVADEATGQLKLTAVIKLGSEAEIVKRLEEFLPVEATTTAKAVYLHKRP